jgi:glycosyltransferase involved in cell wall biosynthesis/peptidoglycan/xylan/chitin deacetylase (PgdA/CDA1 family)
MKDTGKTAICIIVENLAVPADRRVWQEANALAEAGYAVSIICPKGRGYVRSRETLNGIEIYRHSSFNSVGLIGHTFEYGWAFAAEFLLALRVYARTKFRILQACNPPDTIFLIALFFKLFGVRFIFDHHDLVPELCRVRFARIPLLYRLACLAEWLTFRTADVTIATNEPFREIAAVRGGVPRDRSFVVRTCPDLAKLRFTPRASLKEGRAHLVVYVGIMEPQDGVDLLLDSIDHLVNEKGRRDTLFALIGWGTEVPRLRARAAERGLEPWVRFTGPLYGDDLWAYLATADVAVAPDPFNELNDKLSMIKIFEYLAFGLPVVLYDLAEGRRSAGDAALYARNNDAVDFARRMEQLLESAALRREMGARGRSRTLAGLNWDAEKVKLLAAYEAALHPKPEPETAVTSTAKPEPGGPQPFDHIVNRAYYAVKPWLPLALRLAMRRRRSISKRQANAGVWPIDEKAGATPPGWPGWPDGKRFALVLTHDVEGCKGLGRVERLMNLELKHGFRSAFNLVPEGEYQVPEGTRRVLERNGFEVGIHGLEHDGKLYNSKAKFAGKAARINEYLRQWGACGFRSPLMQHRLGWLHRLHVEYDCSTFDTDPFEPESDGVGTVFPFWVPGPNGTGYVELPYSLVQDFTLFVLFREPNIDVWKKKLDWVAAHGGMALLTTHPDYMSFEGKPARDEYPVARYEEFLRYVREKYDGLFWEATPREVARYYRATVPVASRNTRKKVCMLVYSNYEADGRVRRYAETLARRGDHVDVVALSDGTGQMGKTSISGVNVYRIQRRELNERNKWTYASRLLRFLFASTVCLTRRQHRIRYDLVHVHNVPDFLVFAAWYAKRTGAKLILDIHDIVPELFGSKFGSRKDRLYVKLLKAIEKASAAFVDHVIVSNHLWSSKLIARSVPKNKCSVFVNNVDQAVFSPHPRTRSDERTVIVFPGSFQWHQGLDIAIEALAQVRKQIPNVELHLYGNGRLEGDLRGLADRLGLNGSVRFFGSVPLDQMPEVMANADLGVVPKRADGFGDEAYSTKIMEFMSQGVPVIASRTTIDTYYFDETVVRFFASGDVQGLADAMMELIRRKDLRDSLSAHGMEYVARNSWDARKQDYLDLVDSLLAR